jgi:hypothetical protein
MMWTNLRAGQFFSGEFKFIGRLGEEMWLSGTFNPIYNAQMQPYKVIMIAQFTGQEKAKIVELNGVLSAIKSGVPYLELDGSLMCKSANEKFLQLFKMRRLELKNRNFLSLLSTSSQSPFGKAKNLEIDNYFEGEFAYQIGEGVSFLHTFVCPVRDHQNRISRVIVIVAPQLVGSERSLLSA